MATTEQTAKHDKAFMIGDTKFTLPEHQRPKNDPAAIREAQRIINQELRDCGFYTYSMTKGGLGYGG